MRKFLVPLTCLFLLIVGLILPLPPSTAQNSNSEISRSEQRERAVTADVGNPAQEEVTRSAATVEAFETLMARAQAEGPVPVIVGLRVAGFRSEGQLAGPQAVGVQREEITQARNRLMDQLSTSNVGSVKNFEFIPFVAMTVDAAALEQLRSSADVASIEEDIPVPPTLAESVSLIGGTAAWAAGFTGAGQTVAILDTGVDKTHSFLSGKVVSEACYSSNTGNSSSVCPSGSTATTSVGSGVNCADFISGCDHGTHVAGIAAGKGSSFSGVAKDSNIIAIQVFSRFDNSSDCGNRPAPCALTWSSDQLKGLERVYALRSTYNIAAVNMSLGGRRFYSNCDSDNPSYKAMIDNLRSAGIATVISSGNNGYKDSIGSPACISSAISVGSTGDGSLGATQDVVVDSSNSASFLNLLAPGEWIRSSVPGGFFSNFTGTSMAAPHVAGAWAVIKSKKPTATVDEILTALRNTGVPVTDVNGITKPRIKLDAALNAIGGGTNNCSTTPISVGQTVAGTLSTSSCRYPIGSSWYSKAYSFSGTAGQQVAISMTSSAFDAWLVLISPSGAELVNDNDGGGGTNSRIPATSGFYTLPSSGTYTIQATTNTTNQTGNYTISLTAPSTGLSNNNFANAQVINGSTGSVTGSNVGATKESGEPNHAGWSGGASVWYRWQAPASGSAVITTTGSNFDTLLGVYRGSSVNALTTVASNDDDSGVGLTSRVTFSAVGGTVYYIAVDGYGGSTGNIKLNWNLTSTCSYSITPASQTFTSVGGTGTVSVTAGTGCARTAASSNTSWLVITSGASGSGNGTVGYNVSSYTGTTNRSATITVSGQGITRTHTVTQTPPQVNLTPFQPAGWSNKIVVSKTTGTTTDSSPLTSLDTIYIDWAVINNGTGPTAATFSSRLYVDGVLRQTWTTPPPLNVNSHTFVLDYSIGKLSAGQHTIKIVTDSSAAIGEKNEADNEYSRIVTISSTPAPNLTPYLPTGWSDKIVISKAAGNNTDSTGLLSTDTLYVDWAVLNNGDAATATSFLTRLYVDGVLWQTWTTPSPLSPNSSYSVLDYSMGKLSAGQHNIRIVTDVGAGVAEKNELDNEHTKVITVGSPPAANTIQLNAPSYSFNESTVNTAQGFGTLNISVTRTSTTSAATVQYVTSDLSGINECNLTTGHASQRCDYTAQGGTLRFAAGEGSKQIQIPIVSDGYIEGPEIFSIRLQNPVGATLGTNVQATITIIDRGVATTPAQNPYVSNEFFVRMNYLDFLGREPDAEGWATWPPLLNNCGPAKGFLGAPFNCDRAHVSHGFYGSPEFTNRGFLIYRMYEVGMGRLPRLAEFTPDMASLSGFGLPDSVIQQNLQDYLQRFVAKPEFTGRFSDALQPAQAATLILKLELTAGLTLPATAVTLPGQPTQYGRQQLINLRAAGTLTVGQTLKAFVEQQPIYDKYFPRGAVTMEYFAYLKRDPDLNDPNLLGWQEWVFVFTNGGAARGRPDIPPLDIHHLIFGFIYSEEYRKRFGAP